MTEENDDLTNENTDNQEPQETITRITGMYKEQGSEYCWTYHAIPSAWRCEYC